MEYLVAGLTATSLRPLSEFWSSLELLSVENLVLVYALSWKDHILLVLGSLASCKREEWAGRLVINLYLVALSLHMPIREGSLLYTVRLN